jgi:hypothetical protein
MNKRPRFTKKQLEYLYYNKKLSLNQIADKFGCTGTGILYWMNKYEINRRGVGFRGKIISKKLLEKLYWNENYSTWQIARKLGFKNSKNIIWRMKTYGIPIRTRSEAFLLNHPTRKKFIPRWDKKLSYVIGSVLGDGCVMKYTVRLRTTTLEFNKSFEKTLNEINVKCKTIYSGEREKWNTYVCSVEFANFFNNLSLKTIEKNIFGDKDMMVGFIRGFFESEGSAKKWYNSVCVCMANTDLKLLKLIEKMINKLGYKTSIYANFDKRYNKYCYNLNILGSSEFKLSFLNLINPVIKNKPKQYPLSLNS